MTPTTEQTAEWREEFEKQDCFDGAHVRGQKWQGYLRAKTEHLVEIAALKAQLAELMPLNR